MNPPKKELIALDFTEHDTIALLEMLISMCHKNEVVGMVFAVATKQGRKRSVMYGSTGRLADDPVAAAGYASMIDHKFSHEAVVHHRDD